MALILTDQNFHSDNERESSFRYRDFNINQGLISSDPLVTDFFAVREKLFNWFTVSRGSWFRDQDFGSDLRSFLFEKITNSNTDLIVEEIQRVINVIPETELVDLTIDIQRAEGIIDVRMSIAVPSLSIETFDLQIGLDVRNGQFLLG